jgi:hypothetical protein
MLAKIIVARKAEYSAYDPDSCFMCDLIHDSIVSLLQHFLRRAKSEETCGKYTISSPKLVRQVQEATLVSHFYQLTQHSRVRTPCCNTSSAVSLTTSTL